MSEGRARFRVKKGEVEIEYEGKSSEVDARYKEAFDWIKGVTLTPFGRTSLEEERAADRTKPERKKGERRGGPRPAVIGPAIDQLSKEGFLDDFKRDNQIFEELRRRNVTISRINVVQTALNRRVPKTIDRVKDNEGKWVYRRKTE